MLSSPVLLAHACQFVRFSSGVYEYGECEAELAGGGRERERESSIYKPARVLDFWFMAVPATMNNDDEKSNKGGGGGSDDDHEHDMVMPGFRFHPTEEELVEFYLRRKVEGKRFNVELITFLDLYRYDPWELPGICF